MSIRLTVYRCQNCGFTFERRGEPESCPQCGHSFVLAIQPDTQEPGNTGDEKKGPEA